MALSPGTRLGPYEVTAQIGVGGMGEVYQATDTKLKRQVAIKVLPAAVAADHERLARFQREAEVLASLNHPNIAAIYGLEDTAASSLTAGSGQGASKALVMELVEGPTLADRIADGPIPLDEALPIAKQIAEALEAAHEQGIIHRDLKPANVKVRPDGTVKVLDFGLAKVFTAPERDIAVTNSPTLSMRATQAGMILGTAAYMSPEQAKGRETDRRTDIWAFGCVLFEMLTGRAAFEGDDVSEILASVIKGTTTLDQLPASVPPPIRRLLRRCLQKDTRQRFQDIGDVRYELEHVESEPAAPVAEVAATTAPSRRLVLLPWAAGIGLALVVGLAVWALRPVLEPGPVMRFDHALPADRAVAAEPRAVIAVSPDGSGFVYVTSEGLEFRSLDSLEPRLIAGTAAAVGPFISPDGEWVGFWTGGRLVKVPVTGGTPVPLSVSSQNLVGTSWGADGTIWYAPPDGIRRVSENGGESELVIASEGVRFADPQLLPGGDWILFTAGRPGDWDAAQIVAQSLGTGERKVLWEGGRAAKYVETGHLVYAQGNSLFALPMDLESMAVSGGPVPLVEGIQGTVGSGHGANFGVTGRGTLVYLEDMGAAESSRTLALVDRSGGTTFLDVPSKQYLSPRLSPDGRRLAVQTDEVDGSSQLWTYDLSGATAMQRLTIDGNNYRPLWTPDGQRITFASDRDGPTSIYWQAADGSGRAERLTTAPEGTYHFPDSWSGTTLVFRQESDAGGAPNNVANQMDLWTVSLDGGTPGEPQVFRAAPPTQFVGGAVSPDGRWIAYASGLSADLQYQIYVEPFPATGERRLVSRELGIMPLWSRDGRELFYRTINQTGTAPQTLKKISVSTNPSFTFTSEEAVPMGRFMEFAYYRSFDVTPDGERFLVVLPPETTELAPAEPRVAIVVNWFTELQRLVPVD